MDNNIISHKEVAIYIFDDKADFQRFFSEFQEQNEIKILLCFISTNIFFMDSLIDELKSRKKISIKILDFPSEYKKLSFSCRDIVAEFISQFGFKKIRENKTIRDYFRFPNDTLSMWWLSKIAEKHTLKTKSFHTLFKLITIVNLINKNSCNKVFIDISNEKLVTTLINNYQVEKVRVVSLRKFFVKRNYMNFLSLINVSIRYYQSIIKFIVKVKMARANELQNINEPEENTISIVTYFPLIDKEKLKEGKFINLYLGEFQEILEEHFSGRVGWIGIGIAMNDFTIDDGIKISSLFRNKGYSFRFVEEYLSPMDLFKALGLFLIFVYKYLIVRQKLKKIFTFKWKEEDFNLWEIFKYDWDESFLGWVLLQGIFFKIAFDKIGGKLRVENRIIYLNEEYAWEKALVHAVKKKSKAKIFGLQHSSIPFMFLQYCQKPEDVDPSNGPEKPLPDFILCCGKTSAKQLIKSGHSKEKVVPWAAVRYTSLSSYMNEPIPWESRKNEILIITTIDADETIELLKFVFNALQKDKGYRVLIKGHHANPIKPILQRTGLKLKSHFFDVSDRPLFNLLASSRAVIVTNSTVALESVAMCCPVIIPPLTEVLDMNPLSGLSDLPFLVNNYKQLDFIITKIINAKKNPWDEGKCVNFIKEYFIFPNNKKDFLLPLCVA